MAPTRMPPSDTTRKHTMPSTTSSGVTCPTPAYSSKRWYSTYRERGGGKKERGGEMDTGRGNEEKGEREGEKETEREGGRE